MKTIFYIFLYLNIYTGFCVKTFSQKIYLQIETQNKKNNPLVDSLGYKKKHLNFKEAQEELVVFKKKLFSLGYLKAKEVFLKKESDSVFVARLLLGDKVGEVVVFYNTIDFSKEVLSFVSNKVTDTYFVLSINQVESALSKLSGFKARKGYSFSTIKLGSIKLDSLKRLQAKLILVSSEKRTIDSIIVKGYDRFPASFLKYHLGIKRDMIFDKNELIRKAGKLNSLPFATSVKSPEVLFTDKKTHVYLYLKKTRSNQFDGIVGFSTNEKTNKVQFNGYLDLRLMNNLHFGEVFLLQYKADGNEQQNFLVDVQMPYLFKTPVGVDAGLRIFKRDSSFVTTQQQIAANYQINQNLKGIFGYRATTSTNLLDETQVLSIEDYSSSGWVFGLNYIKNQEVYFFPKKIDFTLTMYLGDRKRKSGNDNQVSFKSSLSYIFNLDKKNSIFLRNQTSFLSSDTYLENELFRFGGFDSMRGFAENSIDASLFSVLNTEYRYVASSQIFIHSIIDLGYF